MFVLGPVIEIWVYGQTCYGTRSFSLWLLLDQRLKSPILYCNKVVKVFMVTLATTFLRHLTQNMIFDWAEWIRLAASPSLFVIKTWCSIVEFG